MTTTALTRRQRRPTPLMIVILMVGLGLPASIGSAAPGHTMLVSVSSDGTQGNGFSTPGGVSADGRFVVFESWASNLVLGDTNRTDDIYIHDKLASTTKRVNVASDGTQSNDYSNDPAISGDGRFVVFGSFATNLVAGDTNNTRDIFVHDLRAGRTTRVSVSSSGKQANGENFDASISTDGRYVAFVSFATNLVSKDTNGSSDVFVHDRQTGQTTRVSVGRNGAQANEGAFQASINGNGQVVVFSSTSTNLVPDDTNRIPDVFVRDRQAGVTYRVSVTSDGMQGDGESRDSSISANGRFVAFISSARNLVTADLNDYDDTFVHDRQTGVTTRANVASDGTEANRGSFSFPSLSADGRFVAFVSPSTNLVNGDANGASDIFAHDRKTGVTIQVSITSEGRKGNSESDFPLLSSNGKLITFESLSTNLVPDDTNNSGDVFVHEIEFAYSCQDKAATIIGTAGDDTLTGTDGPDVVVGLGGDDSISGKGGDDIVCGDGLVNGVPFTSGDDTLNGGDGRDILSGDDGRDTLNGEAGNDTLFGGSQPDRLFGGPSNDSLAGGTAGDALDGGNGTDGLDGGPGTDTCTRGETLNSCER